MALQAERIYIGHVQQAVIWGAMRRVADRTAFGFDRRMLVNKWAHFFHMALRANDVLISRRPKLFGLECAVRVMTVTAVQQPLIHLVMERLRK